MSDFNLGLLKNLKKKKTILPTRDLSVLRLDLGEKTNIAQTTS